MTHIIILVYGILKLGLFCLLVCVGFIGHKAWVIVVILDSEGRLRALTFRPENEAVVAGKPAKFRCVSDSSGPLSWARSDAKDQKKTLLVRGCVVNPNYRHLYALANVATGRCDLVVKNASATDAGMYSCSETNGWDIDYSALLAVLD